MATAARLLIPKVEHVSFFGGKGRSAGDPRPLRERLSCLAEEIDE
jgi:hypothetical protein